MGSWQEMAKSLLPTLRKLHARYAIGDIRYYIKEKNIESPDSKADFFVKMKHYFVTILDVAIWTALTFE